MLERTKWHMRSYVYVLGFADAARPLTYVGWTHDVAKRLAAHNAGKGARFTRGRTWVLLHAEEFATRQAAMSREWHLKRDRTFRKTLSVAMGKTRKRRVSKR